MWDRGAQPLASSPALLFISATVILSAPPFYQHRVIHQSQKLKTIATYRNRGRTKRPDSSTLAGYGRGDDVAVRPVPAELVFAHHGHGHFVPRLVFADHGTYGEGSVLDQTDLSPAGENPAAPVLFHRHVNPTEKKGGGCDFAMMSLISFGLLVCLVQTEHLTGGKLAFVSFLNTAICFCQAPGRVWQQKWPSPTPHTAKRPRRLYLQPDSPELTTQATLVTCTPKFRCFTYV